MNFYNIKQQFLPLYVAVEDDGNTYHLYNAQRQSLGVIPGAGVKLAEEIARPTNTGLFVLSYFHDRHVIKYLEVLKALYQQSFAERSCQREFHSRDIVHLCSVYMPYEISMESDRYQLINRGYQPLARIPAVSKKHFYLLDYRGNSRQSNSQSLLYNDSRIPFAKAHHTVMYNDSLERLYKKSFLEVAV
jgi:hypothetical protein